MDRLEALKYVIANQHVSDEWEEADMYRICKNIILNYYESFSQEQLDEWLKAYDEPVEDIGGYCQVCEEHGKEYFNYEHAEVQICTECSHNTVC